MPPAPEEANEFGEREGEREEKVEVPENAGRHASVFSGLPLRKDAPRPATILKCADLLESRGGEVLELFREVTTPTDSAVFPIHLRSGGEEFFVEVETGPWVASVVRATVRRASVLRASSSADVGLEVLSAYPVPEEVLFLVTKSPAALLELDLHGATAKDPEGAAEAFRVSAGGRWKTDLECSTEYLPLVEELLLSALEPDDALVTDGLVYALGCFLGETIRRGVMGGKAGIWNRDPDPGWGEQTVLDLGDYTLDPVGKSRAFLENGAEDSIVFYAGYVTEALDPQA